MKLPLISVIDKLTERIQTYSKIENIQVGLFRLEVEDFPERVFQEALFNALSHRDYQSTSTKIQEMCGFTKQQARSVLDKMRSESLINLKGKGPAARYVKSDGLSDN